MNANRSIGTLVIVFYSFLDAITCSKVMALRNLAQDLPLQRVKGIYVRRMDIQKLTYRGS